MTVPEPNQFSRRNLPVASRGADSDHRCVLCFLVHGICRVLSPRHRLLLLHAASPCSLPEGPDSLLLGCFPRFLLGVTSSFPFPLQVPGLPLQRCPPVGGGVSALPLSQDALRHRLSSGSLGAPLAGQAVGAVFPVPVPRRQSAVSACVGRKGLSGSWLARTPCSVLRSRVFVPLPSALCRAQLR